MEIQKDENITIFVIYRILNVAKIHPIEGDARYENKNQF